MASAVTRGALGQRPPGHASFEIGNLRKVRRGEAGKRAGLHVHVGGADAFAARHRPAAAPARWSHGGYRPAR